jgi:hypothetical protein
VKAVVITLQVISRHVPVVEKRLGICYNKYQYSTERRIHEMLFLVYTDLTAHLPLRFHDLTTLSSPFCYDAGVSVAPFAPSKAFLISGISTML